MQRSGEKLNIALHSNNPRLEIPSGIPCWHSLQQRWVPRLQEWGLCSWRDAGAHTALTLFIPGQLGISWYLVGFLSHRNSSVQFSLLGHARKTNPAWFHIILTQLCCLWVVEIATSHFGKGWIIWDWNQPKCCGWKLWNGSQHS